MDFKVGQVYEHAEDGLMEVTEVRDDGFRVKYYENKGAITKIRKASLYTKELKLKETKVKDLSTLEAKYEKALKEVEELGAMIKDAKVEKDSVSDMEAKLKNWWQHGRTYLEGYSDVEKACLGHTTEQIFNHKEDYTMYLVERTIEKVIEILNNGWILDLSDKKQEISYFSWSRMSLDVVDGSNRLHLRNKSSMYMKSREVYKQAKAILSNFNDKDFLKYYFTGKW